MEHYDWNDGWQFTPVFDPAIVRPESPELELEEVRLPHTVKTCLLYTSPSPRDRG